MLKVRQRMLLKVAGILLVLGLSALANASESVIGGTVQPGDMFCLSPELVLSNNTLTIIGNAVDQSLGSPVVVKWSVWDADTTTRLLKVVDSSVNQVVSGNGHHLQACINNTSTVAVKFNLAQED